MMIQSGNPAAKPIPFLDESERYRSVIGLPWTGVLLPEEIDKLREEFSGLVICPGVVKHFGSLSDDWGKIYLPRANIGYREARTAMQGWRIRLADDLWSWWPAYAAKHGLTIITVDDLLKGVTLPRWKEYRTLYSKTNKRRLMNLRSAKLKAAAFSRMHADPPQDTDSQAPSDFNFK